MSRCQMGAVKVMSLFQQAAHQALPRIAAQIASPSRIACSAWRQSISRLAIRSSRSWAAVLAVGLLSSWPSSCQLRGNCSPLSGGG